MAQSTLHVALAVGMLTTGHHVGLCADLESVLSLHLSQQKLYTVITLTLT